jgi:hypothetical protein
MFVEIPGDRTYELPPLLLHERQPRRLDKVMRMAEEIVDSDQLLEAAAYENEAAALDHRRRRLDLAVNLVEQYLGFCEHWLWGDAILEWIRQCEITFESRLELRTLLRHDLWPHAGRSSFVTLLHDKSVQREGVGLHEAVGLRLTFRQAPPISCFSNQFLLLLNSSVGVSAYETWARCTPDPISSFPPERFAFDVLKM